MVLQVIALFFLVFAIVLGFVKNINVGIVSMGLALVLGLIGGVDTNTILSGFPGKLFVTLLGTMFFFCLLQENKTLELMSKKMVSAVGKCTFLVPVIIYLVSYILSAAGPGAISVQSVMIIFAVSLASQMDASPILMGGMAVLGAVGGTASPIALSGIIVTELTEEMGYSGMAMPVFIGVTVTNVICAVLLYFFFKGYRLKPAEKTEKLEAFNRDQKICMLALLVLVIAVVGFQYDVGLVAFTLSVLLLLVGVVNEKEALKLVPWSVLLLICGVSILMGVTKIMGGIDLLSEFLSKLMNQITAVPVISLTAGLMSWFSSANGVVMPTLIPTTPGIVENLGNTVTVLEMIMGIVGGATVAGISPLSTGGSLILATYTQEMKASEKEQKKIFLQLFATSFAAVLVVVVFGLLGGFKLFG